MSDHEDFGQAEQGGFDDPIFGPAEHELDGHDTTFHHLGGPESDQSDTLPDTGDVLGILPGTPEPESLQEIGALFGLSGGNEEEKETAYLTGTSNLDAPPGAPASDMAPDPNDAGVAAKTPVVSTMPGDAAADSSARADDADTASQDPTQTSSATAAQDSNQPADGAPAPDPAKDRELDDMMNSFESLDESGTQAVLNNLRV